MPGMRCRASSDRMNRSTVSGRVRLWAAALKYTNTRPAMPRVGRQRRSLDGCLALQLIHQPFDQLLSLDHQMAEIVLFGAGCFASQGRQVVGQEVTQENGLLGRKGQLHSDSRELTTVRTRPPGAESRRRAQTKSSTTSEVSWLPGLELPVPAVGEWG